MPYEVVDGLYFDEPPRIIRVKATEGYEAVNFKDVKELWFDAFTDWCDEKINAVKVLRATEVEIDEN